MLSDIFVELKSCRADIQLEIYAQFYNKQTKKSNSSKQFPNFINRKFIVKTLSKWLYTKIVILYSTL